MGVAALLAVGQAPLLKKRILVINRIRGWREVCWVGGGGTQPDRDET